MRDSRRLAALGDFAIDMIQKRTRHRKSGVKRPGANTSRLKQLAKTTIEHRTGVMRYLHGDTTPQTSNLTYTGQMLDSIKLRILPRRGVDITPFGRRFGIKGGKSPVGGVTNLQVAKKVSIDRPFMYLSRGEMTKLVKFYQRTFDTLLGRRGLT